MNAYNGVGLARPQLGDSQWRFRLGLVRQRTRTYPLDSMDFIMMDLERPDLCHRHAHWCTGDLTGRLLEFLAYADGVDGVHEPRMQELFERILRQQRPSGLIGRHAARPKAEAPEDDPASGVPRLLPGLIRYYDLTGDARALDAAVGMARFTLSRKDQWRANMRRKGGRAIEAWVTEPMAMLYGVTKDKAYLDFVGLIEECLESPEKGAHAHGFLATLRGLQVAALVTGDKAWNTKVERFRQTIIEKHYEMPDGGVPEVFPPGHRNEGCTIADWIMVNLNAGLISGDDGAYAKAEHSLWNGFAFNQWITGCFGAREITAAGYGVRHLEECVWCCLHNGGLAMAEFARQAVTFRDGTICVNQHLPGVYRLPMPGRPDAEIRVLTSYPAAADTVVEARHVPADVKVRLRVPACVKRPEVAETRRADAVSIRLKGTIGHHVESCSRGKMFFYGPLLMVPVGYNWSGPIISEAERGNVPTGYIPDDMPRGLPQLNPGQPDADGFYHLSEEPLPDWTFFDGGPGAKCWVPGAAANVPVKFADGQARSLRFVPQCFFTSCLALHETPIVFG
jgi:hypothetical protein